MYSNACPTICDSHVALILHLTLHLHPNPLRKNQKLKDYALPTLKCSYKVPSIFYMFRRWRSCTYYTYTPFWSHRLWASCLQKNFNPPRHQCVAMIWHPTWARCHGMRLVMAKDQELEFRRCVWVIKSFFYVFLYNALYDNYMYNYIVFIFF